MYRSTGRPGQPGRLPETLAPTIQAWGQAGPQRWGRDRAHWTYAELAPSLDQTTGIAVKRTALRVFCQRHAIRPSRPTYRSRRGDPAPQQGAQGALAA